MGLHVSTVDQDHADDDGREAQYLHARNVLVEQNGRSHHDEDRSQIIKQYSQAHADLGKGLV